ncbi:uncharacterized protein [Ptychodera flava]
MVYAIADTIQTFLSSPINIFMVLVAFVLIAALWSMRRPAGLPPGPRGFPFIGNIFDMSGNPMQTMSDFAKIYGDMFSLKIGLRNIVVLNNVKVVREALVKKQDGLDKRPWLYSTDLLTEGGQDITNGNKWKTMRKFGHKAVRNFASGYPLERSVIKVAFPNVKKAIVDKNGEPFNPRSILKLCVCNVLANICFGNDYDFDDTEFKNIMQIVNDMDDIFANGTLADIEPILKYIPTKTIRQMKKVANTWLRFIQSKIDDHRMNIQEGSDSNVVHDVLKLQAELKGTNQADVLTDVQARQIVSDVFGDEEIQAACTNGRPRPIQRSKSPPTVNSAVLQLESHAKAFIHNSIAGSTRKTYQVGQSNYVAFCHTHGLTPTLVTLQSTMLFITNLARNGLKFTTIRVYLAVIIRLHTEMGFKDDISNHIRLQRTMQGIHQSLGDQKRTRLPMTIDILVRLKEALRAHASLCNHDKLMLWSAFTMAFFGFLRVSEFTAPGSHDFDKTCTLLARDVTISEDLEISLKASKTDPYRRGQHIRIAPTNTGICALRAYTKYRRFHAAVAEMPVFQFNNGAWLTRHALTVHLRDLLRRAGIDNAHHFATHSFRSGAATTAADANLPLLMLYIKPSHWEVKLRRSNLWTP